VLVDMIGRLAAERASKTPARFEVV